MNMVSTHEPKRRFLETPVLATGGDRIFLRDLSAGRCVGGRMGAGHYCRGPLLGPQNPGA